MPPRHRSSKEPSSNSSESGRPKRRPATTQKGRENQLVSLAEDLAERQIRDGTASAQVISHYLKLGSSREILEQQRLEHENALLEVKRESILRDQRREDDYKVVMKALRSYHGYEPEEETDTQY